MSFEVQAASQKANSLLPKPALANILGVGIHAVDLPGAADVIAESIASRSKGYVCVTGVHGVMEAQRDPEFRTILDSALLVVPDGMPTVWIGRSQGHHRMRRVFGPDLMLEVCRRSVNLGYTHFFYGGKPGVAEELASNLSQRFRGMKVVGTFTPPFRSLTKEEECELVDRFDRVNPDIAWIGLSTPKQERFMSENIDKLKCRVMLGVGAAFDFHTGRIKDAPVWIKNAGLQWLHRVYQEPSRLWRRYLINNCGFLTKVGIQLLGISSYRLDRNISGTYANNNDRDNS